MSMFRKARYILLASVLTGGLPIGLCVLRRNVVSGLNHFWGSLLGLSGLVLLVFFVLLTVRWFYSRKPGRPAFAPADWFLSAAVGWLFAGVLYARFAGASTIDVQVQDTMFMLVNFHMFDGLAVFFGLAAAVYYFVPEISGGRLEAVPGHIHFWVTFLGLLLFLYFSIMVAPGPLGSGYDYIDGMARWKTYNENALLWTALVVLAAQGVFIFNIVYSALRRGN